jgi:hypothetical protein
MGLRREMQLVESDVHIVLRLVPTLRMRGAVPPFSHIPSGSSN